MTNKNFFRTIIFLIILGLVFIGGISFVVDPYQQYREPKFYRMVNLNSSARFLNPGLIKNRDYSSIIVGSSMMENMDTREIQEKLCIYPLKQTFAGATPREINILLNYVRSLNKVDSIIYGLDLLTYFGDKNNMKVKMPMYLYDNNIFNDYNYLFSFDTYRYMAVILYKNLKKNTINIDELYCWNKNTKYSKEEVLKTFDKNKKININLEIKQELLEKMLENFEYNTLPLIRDNSSVKYTIIFPPYSILTYVNIYEIGTLLKFKEEVIKKLIQYHNVEAYDFQYLDNITFNLNNYKDYSHYSPKINSFMINSISEKKYLVTEENYLKNIMRLKEQIENFEIEKILAK